MPYFERTHDALCAPEVSGHGDASVIAVQLPGGFRLFCRPDEFRENFPTADSAAARGIGDSLLAGLEVFHIKPQEDLAAFLAAKVENHLDRPPGLYRLSLIPPFDLSSTPAMPSGPALVFIHGTASSSRGAFLALANTGFARAIEEKYGANIFAYEHKTLTESPIQNALALAETLPPHTELHLVTHSRGGLIGDLLSLGQLQSPPDPQLLDELFEGRPTERGMLDRLIETLKDRKITVRRFVRVASPARGTTLASGRADRWFSLVLSLFGMLLKELPASPILDNLYDALQDFLIALVHERTDPAVFPGLEAMLPGSPLIRLLNHPELITAADLSVVAGSNQGTLFLGQMIHLLPNLFFGGRHDLVVNYASMDGGLQRTEARLFSDTGENVNHFRYFSNASTRKAVLDALLRQDGDNAGFEKFHWQPAEIPARDSQCTSQPAVRLLEENEPTIRVTIVHADLACATHPIAIGHYSGDSVVGAEAALDRNLGGRLSLHHKLGVYPDRIEDAEVFLEGKGGAIVMGLGPIGSLTPKLLEQTFTHAVLKYTLASTDRSSGVATLLIGTMANVLSVEESLTAMLRAVRAANRISPHPITRLEIIELWEDRAIQAATALERLAETPAWRNVLNASATVDVRAGGLRRLSPAIDDQAWWSRLRITQKKSGKPLHFALITNRARTEIETVREPQRAATLVEAAIGSTSNHNRISQALFELLLPNGLKEYAPGLSRLVLMLDGNSAGYPWELLEDRLGRRQRPLAVEAAIIRQLDVEAKRHRPTATERAALVVGNPQTTKFKPLPGAAAEARDVAHALEAGGLQVSSHIEGNAAAIRTDLYSASYRILHFAGHGVLERGIVLGDDDYFSPSEADQLRPSPELVFLNCCHLGRTDVAAASLASGFIAQGVRAVIVAGWAVDDAAARTFARTFYGSFLKGVSYGEAVRQARERTYEDHPGINTWGAYQCYGDPDYRFHEAVHVSEAAVSSQRLWLPSQLVAALDNMAQRREGIGEELKRLEVENPQWWSRADVRLALAGVQGN